MTDRLITNPDLFPDLAEKNPIKPIVKSKSALKREMTSLQKIGEKLINLSPGKLAKIPMSEELFEAVMLARRLKNREGRRRQMQYIGKCMRSADSQKITMALESFDHQSEGFRQEQQKLEQWRDRLIAEGDRAISELMLVSPDIDRQHLRQLIRQAHKEAMKNKPPAASRKIFAYLRDN